MQDEIGMQAACRARCFSCSLQDRVGLEAAFNGIGLHTACMMGFFCMQPVGCNCYECTYSLLGGISLQDVVGLHSACRIGLVCKF